MKLKPNLSILAGFLFVLDIDYAHDETIKELICSADVNDDLELSRIFDLVVRPEFLAYAEPDQQWLIDTLAFFVDSKNSFNDVFRRRSFLFSDDVADGNAFMRTLLSSLVRYQKEVNDAN